MHGNQEKLTENFGRMTPDVTTYETSAWREENMKIYLDSLWCVCGLVPTDWIVLMACLCGQGS